jgi:DNA-binding PadR family transcriptional regulator
MAASDTTRLLVLGVVRLFGPANGYQLRRELLSWSVESWANVNPGSIYSMLSTLTAQGMVERFDISSNTGARPVAVYQATPAGEAELVTLIGDALTAVAPFDRTALYAALSLSVSLLTRQEVIDSLRRRIENLRVSADGHRAGAAANEAQGFSPPHVARMFGFPVALAEAEIAWMTGFIESVESGEMMFADDDWSRWQPHPEDPGQRMLAEQAAYRSKIEKSLAH